MRIYLQTWCRHIIILRAKYEFQALNICGLYCADKFGRRENNNIFEMTGHWAEYIFFTEPCGQCEFNRIIIFLKQTSLLV